MRDLTKEEKKNVGLLSQLLSQESESFIPNTEKRFSRNVFFGLGSAGVLGEFAYAFFQYDVTYEGLVALGFPNELASILASVGTVLDFGANIWTVSPANDANDNAFKSTNHLSLVSRILSKISFAISCAIAYPVGASGGFLGVFPLIANQNSPDLIYYSVIATLGVALTGAGIAYYIGFNASAAENTFLEIEKYLQRKKSDHSLTRETQLALEAFAVVFYRALGFAAIAVSLLAVLAKTNADDNTVMPDYAYIMAAAFAFVGTAINVISTRIIKTVSLWTNSKFANLSRKEKSEARKNLTPSVYLDLNIASGIATAIGWSMITVDFTNPEDQYRWIAPILVGAFVLGLTVIAHREFSICNLALKQSSASESLFTSAVQNSDILETAPTTTTNSESYMSTTDKIEEADKQFKEISQYFSTNVWVHRIALVCSVGGRLARFASFLHFTDLLASLFGARFTPIQTLGIALALAPPNMRNEGRMFYDGMKETMVQKMSEAYVNYAKSESTETFSVWSKRNCLSLARTTYFKAKLEYTPDEVRTAITKLTPESTGQV